MMEAIWKSIEKKERNERIERERTTRPVCFMTGKLSGEKERVSKYDGGKKGDESGEL